MIIRKKQSEKQEVKKATLGAKTVQEPVETELDTINSYEEIDISNIEFKERLERRRGDRRRGYRRIDERTLVSRAQEEAQNIRELAAKEGYKSGIVEAQKDIESIQGALEDFLGSKKEIYDKVSEDILDISLQVAQKIIKKEVELSDDILKGVVGEVFDQIDSEEQRIVIDVNPDDVSVTREIMPEVLKTSQLEAKIIINGNEEIQKGSCKVTANNGVIDANFSTQLQIIQNAFRSLGPMN